ncbi:dimethylargininase [Mumia quercus]|uniref:dimethylargininase n=1 Tax=Mumia quercus TaxID=2976125 RepID=UPI0021CE87B8|nr:dimethylargininase [Mumia quercus]
MTITTGAALPTTAERPALRTTMREATPRRFLMCRPEHFDVTYAINPWMDPSKPVDTALAVAQWETLRATYESLGHQVDLIRPVEGLPDMVYAANGGVVFDGKAVAASFTYAERQPEGAAYHAWFDEAGFRPTIQAGSTNEGEGDFLVVGRLILAGTGFRTSVAAHHEVREFFGAPVISLELVDPRFYHLDTALAALDERTVAYYPPAFSAASNAVLQQLFPDAILANDEDASVLGLNAVSDGHNVVLTDKAVHLRARLRERGFNPIGVDLSELLKGGGSVKCCTLEVRA